MLLHDMYHKSLEKVLSEIRASNERLVLITSH